MAKQCDCAHLPTCGGPIYKWMLDEWKEVYRCENHLRLQEEWSIYSHKWYRDFFGPNPTGEERFEKIAKLTFMNEPISCDEWFLQHGNKESSQEYDFRYWKSTADLDSLAGLKPTGGEHGTGEG